MRLFSILDSHHGSSVIQWFRSILHIETDVSALPTSTPELYMDDIVLPSEENNLTCPTKKAELVLSETASVSLIDDSSPPPGFSVTDNEFNSDIESIPLPPEGNDLGGSVIDAV